MQQQRDFSLHGAVDLGARKAAAQRREQASRSASAAGGADGGADGGAGPVTVIEVTDELPRDEDINRVREKLSAHGWPLAEPRAS